MCEQLNKGMLKKIPQPELNIFTKDEVDCPGYLQRRASESLLKYNDDSFITAGMDRKLIVKLVARVMLRSNRLISMVL